MRRYALRDGQWDRIEQLLPGKACDVGVSTADNRLFVEAVLSRSRAGLPWRDLPERFGDFRGFCCANPCGVSSGESIVVARRHEQPHTPTCTTRNWPGYSEPLWRHWFEPEMIWPGMTRDGVPTGRRCRQQSCSDAVIQTCLSMKVLSGMALGQTTGFVESLLKLIGLDWAVPDPAAVSATC